MEKFTVIEPYLNIRCGLSEGPFWEQEANVLRFVDIVNRCVYRVDLDVGPSSVKKQDYQTSISVTAELASHPDSFLFGGKEGFGIAKKDSSEFSYVQSFWTEEEKALGKTALMRANDGGVDSKGRFWCSAVCDPLVTKFTPEAVLFRLDDIGDAHRMITGVTIPNGLSWSLDNKTLYFTDSPTQCIFAYDYDPEGGTITKKRIFFQVEEPGVVPDGHAQDVEGNLWVALWGGWKVIKVSPEQKVTAEVYVPTRCPTAVAFAGEDIYITSEAEQQPEKYPESVKYHGSVFKCHVGVQGRILQSARLKL